MKRASRHSLSTLSSNVDRQIRVGVAQGITLSSNKVLAGLPRIVPEVLFVAHRLFGINRARAIELGVTVWPLRIALTDDAAACRPRVSNNGLKSLGYWLQGDAISACMPVRLVARASKGA